MSLPANVEGASGPNRFRIICRRAFSVLPVLILLAFIVQSVWFYGQRAYVEPLWKTWGDTFSDNNVLVAGQNFVTRGFIVLKGVPTDLPLIQGPYIGWPPLADLVNGLLRKSVGDSVFAFRCFALLTYVLFVIYLYAFCALMFGSRWAAAAATMLVCMTPAVYLFTDSLHEHMYMEWFRAALLYHFVKYLRSGIRGHLYAGMVFAFLDTYTSWEHVPFMLALFTLYPLLFRSEVHPAVRWPNIMLFGTAVAAALGLFFLQASLALGGLGEALGSFKERVMVRTLDIVTGDYFKVYGSKHFIKDITPASYLTLNLNRVRETFLIPQPLLMVGVVLVGALTLSLRRQFRALVVLLLFFAISIPWLGVFIQHTTIHGFTIRHLVPWVALLFTFSFAYILNSLNVRAAGWRTAVWSALQLGVAVLLAAVLREPVQGIVENYQRYHTTYMRDLEYRVETKRVADLGLENVAYRFGTVSTSGPGIGTPSAVIDNSYLTADPSNRASFWGPAATEAVASAITVILANTPSLSEINLYAFASKSVRGLRPSDFDLQVHDAKSDRWLDVRSLLRKDPVGPKVVAPGVVRFSYDIGSLIAREVRAVFAANSEVPASDVAICELELWGRLDMNVLNENLLSNGDFEKWKGDLPEDWEYFSYTPSGNQAKGTEDGCTPGSKCFLIWNTELNDSYLKRVVKLAPGAVYELSGRIKVKDVKGQLDSGAFLDIEGDVARNWPTGRFVTGTRDWQPFKVEISTPPMIKPDTRLVLEGRLGHYGNGATGKAWFDDIELKRVR